MDLFGIPFINESNFIQLLLRFVFNLIFVGLMVRIYYYYSPKARFAFTFTLFNVLIFFMCYVMSGINIGVGFGFGLFAIFGILRYRTTTVPIKEMTYLLGVIVLAVVNAIISKSISYVEIIFANVVILMMTYFMETFLFRKKEFSKTVQYENIELIKPDKEPLLIEDLKQKTGLNITRCDIKEMDFLKDSATIVFYYKPDNK